MQLDRSLQAHRPLVVGAAAAAPLIACAVLSTFRDSVANTNAALGLVLIVVAAAATGIRAAGLVAALSSAAWFDFFLTVPVHQFAITDRADVETAVLLVLVGAAVAEIALWGRRQQARASREQGYLDGVVNTAATVGAGLSSTRSLIDQVSAQIVEILHVDSCRFDPGTGGVLAVLRHDGTVTYQGHPVDVERAGLPTDSRIEVVVQSGGTPRGRFLLTAATRVVRPTAEQLRVVVALANQVGAALVEPRLDGAPPAAASSSG
jgi:K+-sensing histidine kinase KdpD